MTQVRAPFGKVDAQTPAEAAILAVTIGKGDTNVNVVGAAAQDMTMNLTIGADVPDGTKLTVKWLSDGTARDLIPGTGMNGNSVIGTVSKTTVAVYEKNGASFDHVGAELID